MVIFYGHDLSTALHSKRWRKKYQKLLYSGDCLLVLCEDAKQRLIELGCNGNKIVIWNQPVKLKNFKVGTWNLNSNQIHLITSSSFVEKRLPNINWCNKEINRYGNYGTFRRNRLWSSFF